jgi:putative ABC transport system permease protein
MGDAMLRQRLGTDPTDLRLSVSLSGTALTGPGYATLDTYIRHGEQTDLGLPLPPPHVHHNTATVPVYLAGTTTEVANLALDYYPGLADHVTVIAGTLDAPDRLPAGTVPVMVSLYTARTLHLHPGERLVYAGQPGDPVTPLLVISGIYTPTNPDSSFWDINAGNLTYESLVTSNLATFQLFAQQATLFSPEYFWLQSINPDSIHLANTGRILSGLARVRSKLAALAPGATLITSLDVAINGFQGQYSLLPSILLILVAPIVAVILYAIAVTEALTLARQAAEIVLIRSRGATATQVFALFAGEGLVLGAVAVLIGPILGLPLARAIGQASGFLSFTGSLPFAVSLSPATFLYAAGTALLCVVIGLLPGVGLARRSMVSFKGELARPQRHPLWQRLFVDLILLALSLYGLDLLVQQGTVSSGDATAVVAQDRCCLLWAQPWRSAGFSPGWPRSACISSAGFPHHPRMSRCSGWPVHRGSRCDWCNCVP